MALLRCDFDSEVLRLSTSMTVILPQTVAEAHPTLYLLHGLTDDNTSWTRYSSIERYAAPLGLAVVMPQVHRSFYIDEKYGNRFWTFLNEELPVVAASFFRLSQQREHTYVAGLSMGGYGTLRWALREPGRFAAAAALSSATDMVRRHRLGGSEDDPHMMTRLVGDDPVEGTDLDLYCLLDKADPVELPALYLGCGTEDPLIGENAQFRDACAAKGINVTADFGPGGHNWRYWDDRIQHVLSWLPLPEPAAPLKSVILRSAGV